MPGSVDGPAEEITPQGQPAHESREHGADGESGGAEDENEHSHPQHLVDEAAQARQQEAEEDDRRYHEIFSPGKALGG